LRAFYALSVSVWGTCMGTLNPTAVPVGEHCMKFTYGPLTLRTPTGTLSRAPADVPGEHLLLVRGRLAMLGFDLLEELDRAMLSRYFCVAEPLPSSIPSVMTKFLAAGTGSPGG
jgi:hypothetical protein